MKVQVNDEHYNFTNYYHKERWISIWKQIDLILKYKGKKILEVGPGAGILKDVIEKFDVSVDTLDLDPRLEPTILGSLTNVNLDGYNYDIVCAFQILEHIPYENFISCVDNMLNGSQKYVIFSLPNAKQAYRYSFKIPFFKQYDFFINLPVKQKEHIFDGEHYWEVEKKGYAVNKIIYDLSSICNIEECFRLPQNPYHHFFVVSKK